MAYYTIISYKILYDGIIWNIILYDGIIKNIIEDIIVYDEISRSELEEGRSAPSCLLKTHAVVLQWYLAGQGDLISGLVMWMRMIRVTLWVIGVINLLTSINLLTKFPRTPK